jgi:aspartate kinase
MIVMKFGGSSVESAAAIERVAGIVKARLDRHPIVVVSAMGKTTNRLLAIAEHAVRGDRDTALRDLHSLRDFHLRESSMERTVDEHFLELTELVKGLAILGELTPRSIDAISSFGERLSSLIVTRQFGACGIKAVHVDSRKLIVTDGRHTQAVPLFAETYARLAATIPALAEKQVVVMGGFIASNEAGVTTTLGRGGSDYTASIVGAGLGAEEIQIWTDVDGMLTAAELAYFGAKVLHPATVLPAVEKNIPVLILNSRRPEVEGTRIVAQPVVSKSVAKSIACKKDITLVNVHSTRMLMAHGFLRRVFEIFDRYETAVDMIATSEVNLSLTVDNAARLDRVRADLEQFSAVSIENNNSIICLVGDNIRYTPGVAARVFNCLRGVNVRMLSQGASLLNISFVVSSDDLVPAVEALHKEFFTDLDPEVFD